MCVSVCVCISERQRSSSFSEETPWCWEGGNDGKQCASSWRMTPVEMNEFGWTVWRATTCVSGLVTSSGAVDLMPVALSVVWSYEFTIIHRCLLMCMSLQYPCLSWYQVWEKDPRAPHRWHHWRPIREPLWCFPQTVLSGGLPACAQRYSNTSAASYNAIKSAEVTL